jgi:hypothetical protein
MSKTGIGEIRNKSSRFSKNIFDYVVFFLPFYFPYFLFFINFFRNLEYFKLHFVSLYGAVE